ncbi:MAG: radical SAM protein [Candidatus Parcubacteria bacterium]|nr:radical SAM protein [Candidatus Parcubacteria bacterium]
MSLIRLTNLCNEKCLFCNFPDDCRTLSLDEVKKEIETSITDGSVTFTGGEPTIFQYLKEAISYAKQKNIKNIELQSNCFLLADINKAKELKQAGLTGVFVTIHSDNEKIFEQVTQVLGSFQKNLQGIKNLIDLGIKVRINIVINSLNYKDLLSITKFIYDKFPQIESIDYSFVVPVANVLQRPYLLPKINQVVPYLKKAYEFCQENKINFSNPGCGVPLCFIPEYKENSLEYNILKSSKQNDVIKDNQTEKIKFPKCQDCEFDQYCLGFWPNYIKIHGDSEFI